MQDLVTDRLASKRIPAASTLNSLPHLIGEYAKSIRIDRDHNAVVARNSAAKLEAASAQAIPAATGIASERTYTGYLPISGTLSADNGKHGNWTGSLKSTLYVGVDAAGNGTGYEHFSGNITLHVDGKSATEPLTFDTPFFTLQRGKFSYPSGKFTYGNLIFSVNVKGSFSGTQQTISEHLSLPFNGFVNGVGVSGALHGDASVKTLPLTIGGTSSPLTSYEASNTRPFHDTLIMDLSGTAVTATVTLSTAANGTLTNLAGGTYNRAKGTYTITGTDGAVSSAIKGLTFVAADDLASSGRQARTYFTLHVTDGAHGVRNVQTHVTTSAPVFISGIPISRTTNGTTALKLFQNVSIGEIAGAHLDAVRIRLSNPGYGMLENLTSGVYYNKKTGLYVFHGTAAAATAALKALEFAPAKAGVTTTFTITAENTNGALRTTTTTVVSKSAGVSAHAKAHVALFSQYVALGLHGTHDHGAALSSRHDQPTHLLSELAGSHR